MLMQRAPDPYEFYDSVVSNIESGDKQFACARFIGVLDALVASGINMQVWREALIGHRLGEMLGFTGFAPDQSRLIFAPEMAEFDFNFPEISSASAFGVNTRSVMAQNAIHRAVQTNQSVLTCDPASHSAALDACPAITETDNLFRTDSIAEIEPLSQRFDLIVALQFVSRCVAHSLTAQLSNLASFLTPGGSLLLSSFLPFHVGSGWRLLCADDEPHMHSEDSLAARARDAGLELSTFRESQNALLWAFAQRQGLSNHYVEKTPWIQGY